MRLAVIVLLVAALPASLDAVTIRDKIVDEERFVVFNSRRLNDECLPICVKETTEPQVLATAAPTKNPTPSPTPNPTPGPTKAPTSSPTKAPTRNPTKAPTPSPTKAPTPSPTKAPTPSPTKAPTPSPTKAPTPSPTKAPTPSPTKAPTPSPTKAPTPSPTKAPTNKPTVSPTANPTVSDVVQFAPPAGCPAVNFDFSGLSNGDWIHDQFWDTKCVRVTAFANEKSGSRKGYTPINGKHVASGGAARVFDTGVASNCDSDLMTPSPKFYNGPGTCSDCCGGGPYKMKHKSGTNQCEFIYENGKKVENPYKNDKYLGNVLIIQERATGDENKACPDDTADGGYIMFEFCKPVSLKAGRLLDVDGAESADIEFTYSDGSTKTYDIGTTGDNGYWRYDYEEENVERVIVKYTGSGSVEGLEYWYCPDAPATTVTEECECEAGPTTAPMSWKCGNDVYYCPGVTEICSTQPGNDSNFYELTEQQCTDMKLVELGQKCLALPQYNLNSPKSLSNRVCYASDGTGDHAGMKHDGTCDICEHSISYPFN